MSEYSDVENNRFSSIDSPNSLMTNVLQKISKDSLDIKNIINSISKDEFKSSDLIDYILEDLEENNQDTKDLFIEADTNFPSQIFVKDFTKNSSKVLLELSKATTNSLIQYLSAQYSKFLPCLSDLFNKIYEILNNPEKEFSKIAEDKINEILSSFSNDYLDISVENFNISGKEKNEKLKFDLNSIIMPPKPFVKIKMGTTLISKEIAKITFQIKGTLHISNVEISKNKSNYILNPGELIFTLTISLQKLSLMGNENLFSRNEEDEIKELSSCKYEKKFKKITLS